jgi:hypothetical protein
MKRCAEVWRQRVLEQLPQDRTLVLLIGGYAQRWHLGRRAEKTLTATVANWKMYARDRMFTLPHPSWRNTAWLKRNPWFEDGCPARAEARGSLRIIRQLTLFAMLAVSACATPSTQEPFPMTQSVTPEFLPDQNIFVSYDGARLGLTYWDGQDDGPAAGHVVVGLHGMNDYANAFHMAAPYWASKGVTVYAYDQRGFGRSPGRGIWPDEELMREDLRTAVDLVKQYHP